MKNYENIARSIIDDADRYDVKAPAHSAILLTGIIGMLAEIAALLQQGDGKSNG